MLRSRDERESAMAELIAAREALALPPLPPPPLDTLPEQTARWCRGELSNFDYILFLNDCAG